MASYALNLSADLERDAFIFEPAGSNMKLTHKGITRPSFKPGLEGYAGMALQILDAALPARQGGKDVIWSFPNAGPFSGHALRMLPYLAFDALPKFFSRDDRRATGATLKGEVLVKWMAEMSTLTNGFSMVPVSLKTLPAMNEAFAECKWGGRSLSYPMFPPHIGILFNVTMTSIQESVTAVANKAVHSAPYCCLDEQAHSEALDTFCLSTLNNAVPPCTDGRNAVKMPIGLASATAAALYKSFRKSVVEALPALFNRHSGDPKWNNLSGFVVPSWFVSDWVLKHQSEMEPSIARPGWWQAAPGETPAPTEAPPAPEVPVKAPAEERGPQSSLALG